MLPLDMQAAMLRMDQAQKALSDFVDSGSRDKVKAADLVAASTEAMKNLATVLAKFSEGTSTIQ
jgi:hypothetical protein